MTRHFLSAEAQARFSQARLDAVRSIGRLAVEEGCGFVVVCGDVFESNQIDRQVLARALDAMGATPEVTFCLLPGNHDPLDAASIYRSNSFSEGRPVNVVVLGSNEPLEVADGLELLAAPWTSKQPLVDLVNQAVDHADPSDAVRIVVGHGRLDSRSPDTTDPALISLSRLEERIRYSGALEPTDYDEIDPGNVLLVELDADGCSVEPRRVGAWAFELVERRLASEPQRAVSPMKVAMAICGPPSRPTPRGRLASPRMRSVWPRQWPSPARRVGQRSRSLGERAGRIARPG